MNLTLAFVILIVVISCDRTRAHFGIGFDDGDERKKQTASKSFASMIFFHRNIWCPRIVTPDYS